ncbi:MAG: 2-oxo-4-hydroxy-4-carboxy-5-ureidoimidazoline decarboxylase [Rhodocyclaceae bacterium]
MTTLTAASLSALPQDGFVQALEGIFEHSPWVAARAWMQRPFASREALLEALCSAMLSATHDEQLALIRAHPELAGKAAVRGELTAESTREQAGARLDACSPQEFERLQALNSAYGEKFGFPFILAVRGYDRTQIIACFAERLANDVEKEFGEALRQITRIARLRIEERVAD